MTPEFMAEMDEICIPYLEATTQGGYAGSSWRKLVSSPVSLCASCCAASPRAGRGV